MKHTVDVELEAGSIQVIAEQRDAATATVEPADSSSASQEAAEKTRVEQRGNTFYVHAPKSRWIPGRTAKLNIEIRTPLDSDLRVTAASADLVCHGQLAGVSVKSASGDAIIERATGDVSIKTASGQVEAGQVDGDLRVETASGDVSTGHVGGQVKISAASGDVEIGQAGSSVSVNTASGDVSVGAPRRGEVQAKTTSGDVVLRVPAGTAVWLDLNTISGTTRTDLDMGAGAPPGGPDLTLRVATMSGDIDVRRAAHPAAASQP